MPVGFALGTVRVGGRRATGICNQRRVGERPPGATAVGTSAKAGLMLATTRSYSQLHCLLLGVGSVVGELTVAVLLMIWIPPSLAPLSPPGEDRVATGVRRWWSG